MTAFLAPHGDRIYAALRIVAGFLFLCHGAQKILGFFGGPPEMPAPMLWIAGGIELVGGALVMVGFRTGWAAFLCSGLMAAAYFMAHQPKGLLPIENHGELAALYSFVFLLIAVRGSGTWSIDGSR
jgi:putative oxidoreductase